MANSTKIIERGSDGIAVEALIPASQPGDVFPAGAILDYAGSAAPSGWLICDGSVVARATYPQLFANIGTTFGAGDGSTTFGIPDLRGKIPVGKHSIGTFVTLGATGGEENHALSVAEMPAHNHGGSTGTGTSGTQAAFNTLTENQQHAHSYTVWGGSTVGKMAPGSVSDPTVPTASSSTTSVTENAQHTHTVPAHSHTVPALSIPSQGSGGSHNNMPPYVVLNKIIRAY